MPSMRTAAIAFLTASGTLLLAALVITLYGHRHELEWGSVPVWLGGAFALAASVISMHSLRTSRQSLKISRTSLEQATEKRDDDYAAQARLVVVEYDDSMGDSFDMHIMNYSDSIVFEADLAVHQIRDDGTRTYVPIDILNSPYGPDELSKQTIPPGTRSGSQVYVDVDAPFDYSATFTDARGIKWKRVNREQPERVIDNPK